MLKRLIALGTVVGAAAYLQDKTRRDRLFASARELLDGARQKLDPKMAAASSSSSSSERAPMGADVEDAEWSENVDTSDLSDTSSTSTARRY